MDIMKLPPHLSVSTFKSTTMLTCTAVAVLLIYAFKPLMERWRYPPGPVPLPLIGHSYVILKKNMGRYRYDNWRCFGPVVSWCNRFLDGWRVDLMGYDAIHEAFAKNSENFSQRPFNGATELERGLIFGTKSNWPILKSHALTVLRGHGMNKSKMESMITEEIEHLMRALAPMSNRTVSSKEYKQLITCAVANVTTHLIFGHRIDYGDHLCTSLVEFPEHLMTLLKVSALPFLKNFPGDPLRFYKTVKPFDDAVAFFKKEIQDHKKAPDYENPRDYIESFLAEAKKTDNPLFNEDELLACVVQLYVGGSETTSSTLLWMTLYLANNPDVQEKLYSEIQSVVGGRPVRLSDRESMPYTHAIIYEVLRVVTIATYTLPYICTADTRVAGYLIPKGTVVSGNLWSTTHDENVYPDPDTFNPGRFLTDDGKLCPPVRSMLPFSVGRRSCPGDTFAKAMLFMFVVSIMQQFEVRRLTEEKLSEESVVRFSQQCLPYDMFMAMRPGDEI